LPTFSFIVLALATGGFYAHRSMVSAEHARWFALGLPYMAGGGLALIYIRNSPDTGLSLTAYLFAIAWGMDIGGYFCGRLVGGPKLAPTISPNKTWAGFIGGIVLAAILASVVLLITGATSFVAAVVLAMLLAVTAQAGDLFKSFFKRRAGVKDCGNLIPGHGGVLDRIDGLIVAALFLALLRLFFGVHLIG
jgi:phosphatidate cytidylyltransferase